jgi:predicted RNase H-like HicB family nuclease
MGNEIPGNPYLKHYQVEDPSPASADPLQSEPIADDLPPEEFYNDYENFDDGEAARGGEYDNFVGFDEGGAGGYTRQAGNEMIQDFWTWLQDSDLTGAERQNIATQIREAEGFLANSSGDQLSPEAQNALGALQARIHGGSEVGVGDDPFGLDELIVEEDSGEGNLTEELQSFKTSLASMTNLTPEKRQEFESQIDQWLSNLNLGNGDPEQIWDLFETLKDEVNQMAAFSPVEQSLGEALGIGAEAAHALMEKHGLDPNNLPPPDDSRILDLLNDPELEGIHAAANGVTTAEKNLEEFIDLNKQQANAENQTREADTSNYTDSKDVTVFKNLYEASKHEDDRSVDLIDAHEKFGEEIAKVLTALYGEEATVTQEDTDLAGVVRFDGKSYRFDISGTGDIDTTSDLEIDWPEFELVAWHYDAEGSGNLGRPQWVKDADYPAKSYDGGGGSRST